MGTCVGGTRRGLVGRAVAWAVLAWAVVGAAPARADDTAWRERLGAEVARLEAALAARDGQAARPSDALLPRILALHGRVSAIERAAGAAPGVVEGLDDLAALTRDVGALKTRLKRLDAPASPKAPTPAPPPRAPPAPAPPPAPAAVAWPPQLAFPATAKVDYEETGFRWLERATLLGLEQTPYLMDGYAGSVSFTVRVRDLVRPVRKARLRVRVRMEAPFAESAASRDYDVEWVADRVLSDGALKTWMRHDSIRATVPRRWIVGPRRTGKPLDAKAHVLAVTTEDGKEVAFDPPPEAKPSEPK